MNLNHKLKWAACLYIGLFFSVSVFANISQESIEKQYDELREQLSSRDVSEGLSPIALEQERILTAYLRYIEFQRNIISELDRTQSAHQNAEVKLTKANAFLAQNKDLYNHLEKDVNPVWRQLLEGSFQILQRKELLFSSPKIPPANFEENKDLYEEYLERQQEGREKINQLITKQINEHNNLLIQAGQLRSMFFQKIQEEGNNAYSLFNLEHLKDIQREVTAIPLHWRGILFNKVFELKKRISMGPPGYRIIADDMVIVFIVALIPLIITLIVRGFQKLLDQLKEGLLKQPRSSVAKKAIVLWLQRLSPFIPWIFSLIGLNLANMALLETSWSEITLFIPYIRYYFYYKIFRRFMDLTLLNLTTLGNLSVSHEVRSKIHKSSKISGLYIFLSLILLHSFQSVVVQGIAYELIGFLVTITGVALIIFLAQVWKEENAASVNQLTRGKWFQKISKLNRGPLGYVIGLPLFFISIFLIIKSTLAKWGDEFDISKRVSARFFRKQLESSEKLQKASGGHVPKGYLDAMKSEIPSEEVVKRNFKEETLNDIKVEIDNWLDEQSDEHSLAIYGDNGIGKSTFLRILESHYSQLDVIRVEVPPKLTTAQEVLSFFSDVLKVDLKQDFEKLIDQDAKMPARLILVDKAHNMFLSRVNGFEGYREFINLINAQTQNIFWCASFHTYSWRFLDTVFKKNQYFRTVKNIGSWSENDIRELILSRHSKTEYKLSYDTILEAAKAVDDDMSVEYVEEKFFRLLWEQAQGNPYSAIYLWISALNEEGENTLHVGLPNTSEQTSPIYELPDEALFVYTALITHENLTSREAISVTNLERGEVNYALKVGLENGILIRGESDRYTINTLKHASLVSQLRKKNFIYGNG